jgi:hypothetical protein
MVESISRKIMVHSSLGKKQDSISKIPRVKRAGVMAQAVEHLPSKCDVLSSSPSKTNKQTNKKTLIFFNSSPKN